MRPLTLKHGRWKPATLLVYFRIFNQNDPNVRFDSIRIGGGVQGELRYPPPLWNGHKNSYWAFDAYAQNTVISGIPANLVGWRPGIDANPGTPGHGQLIINPGFETTDSYFPVLGWSPDNEVDAAIITNNPHGGLRALKVDINASGRIHQYVRVAPGTTYEFSIWVKSGSATASARLFLNQYQTQSQASSAAPVKLESGQLPGPGSTDP